MHWATGVHDEVKSVWRFRSVLTLVACLAATGGAEAASSVCTRLEAQLASASSAGSSSKYKRYNSAVKKQASQIEKARGQLKRLGCSSGSIVILGGSNGRECKKLSSTISKMGANLRALTAKRDSFAGGGNNVARKRIEAALRANGCRKESNNSVVASVNPKKTGNGISRIIGDAGRETRVRTNTAPVILRESGASGGNYRTMCVRTCDGFYFPISSRASSSHFSRDARACQLMCPGTQTELYYHSITGQDSEDMVSAQTRQPYTAMPRAFAYRTEKPNSNGCSCNLTAFHREMARREAILSGVSKQDAQRPVTIWVKPDFKSELGEDPETIANLKGNLTDNRLSEIQQRAGGEKPLERGPNGIRVVGPVFLPDPENAIDLRTPPAPIIAR